MGSLPFRNHKEEIMNRKIILASPTQKSANLSESNERTAVRDDDFGFGTSARLENFESYTKQINQMTELMLSEIDTRFQGEMEPGEVPKIIGELQYYLNDQLPRVEQSIKYAINRISALAKKRNEGI